MSESDVAEFIQILLNQLKAKQFQADEASSTSDSAGHRAVGEFLRKYVSLSKKRKLEEILSNNHLNLRMNRAFGSKIFIT